MQTHFAELRGQMQTGHEVLEKKIEAGHARNLRLMIRMFVPVWLGSWGTVVAVLLRG